MTWAIVAVAVIVVLIFISSKKKPAGRGSSGSTVDDSRRLLAGLVLQNRNRFSALPEDETNELISALRQDAETHWNHAYNSAISDGKDGKFATHLALFSVACAIMTGEQHPDKSFNGGLDLETVPFKSLPPEQAKSAFIEYCIAKYLPRKSDWDILNPALLKFADEVFENAKSETDADGYIYEMIYRETLDWQKILAEALSATNKAKA